jgi:hypothetical protein
LNRPDGTSRGLSKLRLAPERLFLIAALLGGLLLVALIPPVAGGNEQMNFRRVVSIANGHLLVEPAIVPGGIAELFEVTQRDFREGAKPPYSYSRRSFDEAAALKLEAHQPQTIPPNPIAVLHPISYLPQVPAVWLAQVLGLSPLLIFYVGRLAGLAAAIALTFFAIRIIPFHKYTLAAVALLPPLLFSRSTLDADQFTTGVSLLFLALVLREAADRGRMSAGAIAGLAVVGFALGQAKSAYLLLPLLSLAIPADRFGGWRGKARACAIICLPGLVASLGWMLLVKHGYFEGMRYRTWSGVVDPDRQLALILSDPLGFAETLLRTLFTTPFIPKAVIDVLGTFGPPVTAPAVVLAAILFLLAGTAMSDQGPLEQHLRDWRIKAFALALAAVTLLIIVTLLYLQWTRFGSPVVHGFNGRYLYPLAPLLLLAIPSVERSVFGLRAPAWLFVLAVVSVIATAGITWRTYIA